MRPEPVHHTIVAMDVANSGNRDDLLQLRMRADLREIVSAAFTAESVPGAADITDLGDGIRLIVPASISPALLLDPFIPNLATALRNHRRVASDAARLRLRVAVHMGLLHHDAGGWAGRPLVTCARMLDAVPVRRLLTAVDDADLVLVVSDAVYDGVVRHGYGLDPASFHRTSIVEKETVATVWLHVPGYRPAPSDHRPAAPVAVGWGYVCMPTGQDLRPLLPETWGSWQVRHAVEQGDAGTVVTVARQAHGLHQSQLATMSGFSQQAISQVESGNDLAHDIRVLRRLQRLLGIPPHLLGLSDEALPLRQEDAKLLFAHLAPDEVAFQGRTADGRTVPVAIDRHTLLSLSMSATLGAPPVDALGLLDGRRPIDPDMLRRLRVIRRLLNESDNWLGPGSLLPVVRQMYQVVEQARRTATGDLRRQLLYLAALYAEFRGWLRQEVGDLTGANAWTERALQQAQAADDANLSAYAQVRLGQLAEVERDDDRVIGLARAAQRGAGLSAQTRALVFQQEARGHAIAGNETACLTRLDQARTAIIGIRPRWTDEYEVGFFFDEPHLDVQQAACLFELGRTAEAIAAYEANLGAAICRWEQGVNLAKLARAHVVNAEPDRAAATGFQALNISRETGNLMIIDELRKLPAWGQLATLREALDATS
jgi:transcriptional regulator with XRE-family HTH domain